MTSVALIGMAPDIATAISVRVLEADDVDSLVTHGRNDEVVEAIRVEIPPRDGEADLVAAVLERGIQGGIAGAST